MIIPSELFELVILGVNNKLSEVCVDLMEFFSTAASLFESLIINRSEFEDCVICFMELWNW